MQQRKIPNILYVHARITYRTHTAGGLPYLTRPPDIHPSRTCVGLRSHYVLVCFRVRTFAMRPICSANQPNHPQGAHSHFPSFPACECASVCVCLGVWVSSIRVGSAFGLCSCSVRFGCCAGEIHSHQCGGRTMPHRHTKALEVCDMRFCSPKCNSNRALVYTFGVCPLRLWVGRCFSRLLLAPFSCCFTVAMCARLGCG